MFLVTYPPYKNRLMCGTMVGMDYVKKRKWEAIKAKRWKIILAFVQEFDRRRQAGFADFPDSFLRTVYDRVAPIWNGRPSMYWRDDTYRVISDYDWFKKALWERNYKVGKTLKGVTYVEKDGFRITFYSEGQPNGRGKHLRKECIDEQEEEESEYSVFI